MPNCPAHRCTASVTPGQIFCRAHWHSLPAQMRSDIWRAWRVVQNWRGKTDRATRRAQIAQYRICVSRAIEHFDRRFTDIFDQSDPDATIHISPASETALAGANRLSPENAAPASDFVIVPFAGTAS